MNCECCNAPMELKDTIFGGKINVCLQCGHNQCHCQLSLQFIENHYKPVLEYFGKKDIDVYFLIKENLEISHSWERKDSVQEQNKECFAYSKKCVDSLLLGLSENRRFHKFLTEFFNSQQGIMELYFNLQTWEQK